MAFRGEVHDRPRTVGRQQTGYQRHVADVAADEYMPGIAFQVAEAPEISRVGELVEIDDRAAFAGHPMADEIRADESRAAGDE